MSDSLQPHGLYSPQNSPGQNIGVGSHSLLQGIFPTQGSNPGLPHCRRILYQLGHQGSPRILSLLQQIFLTQELNWGLPHCRRILYQLSYQGSPWTTREFLRVCNFRNRVREATSEKVTFESRPEGGEDAKHVDSRGKDVLGRGDSRGGGRRGGGHCPRGVGTGQGNRVAGRGPGSRM